MRIAYVEDNLANLALVERIANIGHHEIASYAEGEIAREELARERFDLILMDVELAGEISGLQVVRHLRQLGIKTPIIAVTAYAMIGDREKCLEAGCDGYLPKPLPITELLAIFARYLPAAPQPAVPADAHQPHVSAPSEPVPSVDADQPLILPHAP
ncbi:MAG: response regulator [Anaerolineae bacterium]|nr:response regulator [Anaerolineae bacterium]